MDFIFEKLEKKHQKEVADILNYYIENTTAAYREEVVDEDFSLNFLEGPDVFCSFVIKTVTNKIVGFCTLEPHMAMSTFSEVAEVMYFIHHEYTGKGAGSLALKIIEDKARTIGVKKLLADSSTENIGSIDFHKSNGFIEYGRLLNVGKKLGRSFGVAYFVKDLC
nr:GNAT family N-acetyltransferase [Clostridium sp. ATCC 25772]